MTSRRTQPGERRMSKVILRHYDLSPFAEKIRLALWLKGIDWRSVVVDPVPSRPVLGLLTRGLPAHSGRTDRRRHLVRHRDHLSRAGAGGARAHALSRGRGADEGARALVGPGALEADHRGARPSHRRASAGGVPTRPERVVSGLRHLQGSDGAAAAGACPAADHVFRVAGLDDDRRANLFDGRAGECRGPDGASFAVAPARQCGGRGHRRAARARAAAGLVRPHRGHRPRHQHADDTRGGAGGRPRGRARCAGDRGRRRSVGPKAPHGGDGDARRQRPGAGGRHSGGRRRAGGGDPPRCGRDRRVADPLSVRGFRGTAGRGAGARGDHDSRGGAPRRILGTAGPGPCWQGSAP